MAKSSVITLPDGTKIEVSPDLNPEQITAMITALTSGAVPSSVPSPPDAESGDVIVVERSVNEIWESSKKEQVALFIRTYMSETLWFGAKDVMDQQLASCGKIVFGETSAIGTYLQRLFEGGYLDKKKTPNGRNVSYRITQKLIEDYPLIGIEEIKGLLMEH